MKYKIGFIGCGNMGGALVKAVARVLQRGEIAVCDRNDDKVKKLQEECGAIPLTAEEIARECEFAVLGVKPQAMAQALSPIAGILRERTDVTLITMAAGLSISAVRALVGRDIPTIRIMPNTPVTVGEGMILYASAGVSEEKSKFFLEYFSKAGVLSPATEEELDVGGGISGCGPAFVYLFTEALIQAGIELGLSEKQAETYAVQTVKGSAEMMLAFGEPASLRKAVCSPNGTTLAGIAAMEKEGFSRSVKAAVHAAYQRTLELKK